MGIDHQQDRAVEQRRKGKPARPTPGQRTFLAQDSSAKADHADADTGQEIAGIEQNPAGLDRQRKAVGLQPAHVADDQPHRNIDDDRGGEERRKRRPRPVAQRKDQQAGHLQQARRHCEQRSGCDVERQQHPQKPCRARRPGTNRQRAPPEMKEVEIGGAGQMVAQEGRIIRNRHQHEDRNQKGNAEPPRAIAQEVRRSPAGQAVVHEQARDQEHAGHEEAVVEQHDEVEPQPAHFVAVAEMGVVDRGMVDQHQQRDEGARAVERNDAPPRLDGPVAPIALAQHLVTSHRACAGHFSNAS